MLDVLTRLAALLSENEPSAAAAQPSPTQQNAATLYALQQIVFFARDHLCFSLAVVTESPPAYSSWVAMLRTPAPWEQIPGKATTWRLDHSAMRSHNGYLTTSSKTRPLKVAFDEGAEVATITLDALQQHMDSWVAGHPPFCNDPNARPPLSLS